MGRYSSVWMKELSIVRTAVLPHLTCTRVVLRVRISASTFVGIDTLVLKFVWRVRGPRIISPMWSENSGRTLDSLISGLTGKLQ